MGRRIVAAWVLGALTVSLAGPGQAVMAKSQPRVRVEPTRVKIGQKAMLVVQNVKPRIDLIILVAVPDARTPVAERFVSHIVHTNASGSVRATISIPLIPACGAGRLYVFNPKALKAISTAITVTGCKAGGTTVPPPPPAPGKPSKPPKHP